MGVMKKSKLIFGIGVNDANYVVQPTINGKQVKCPFYSVWCDMIRRCYDNKYHAKQPTYIGCSVDKRWHSFLSFRDWMVKQEWRGNHLDKDIIKPNNRVYSPESCAFVSRETNNILNSNSSTRGSYPRGVSLYPRSGKFLSSCGINGKKKHLGYYDTIKEASEVYRKFKSKLLFKLANKQTDVRVKNGLIMRATLFQ